MRYDRRQPSLKRRIRRFARKHPVLSASALAVIGTWLTRALVS